jgi:pyruvate formate lyase activating enzyme
MEAKYYIKLEDQKTQCRLCQHLCIISNGYKGICRVRENRNGSLYTLNYESFSAVNFDPIEKKPLYHFHPGKEILSLGAIGCNFHCACCQNYEISQTDGTSFPRTIKMSSSEIINLAFSHPNNIGIAFTYNEPTVWFEQMIEIAAESKKRELQNVVVSNGYINPIPLTELMQYTDAFNIDLKSFNNNQHKSFSGGDLFHVLNNLVQIIKGGRHLEVTFLVVPGINDSPVEFKEMVNWIYENLGKDIPLHISRYFPRFKMTAGATSSALIKELTYIAAEKLAYVYNGNIADTDFQNTVCPNCSQMVVSREGYFISQKNFGHQGECNFCGHQIIRV